jgi:DNA-binding MarR family transcriptional regulator
VATGIGQIDDIIHGRMRLGIMVYLAENEVAEFNELKSVLEATQGNLSVHMRKLEEAAYVEIEKSYVGRKGLTRIRITPKGRKAFAGYVEALAGLLGKG